MLVSAMSVKDHSLLALKSRFLQILATYSSKPNTSAIPLCEKTTVHWAWEMMRVACTHPMNPPGVAYGGGVLSSRVA